MKKLRGVIPVRYKVGVTESDDKHCWHWLLYIMLIITCLGRHLLLFNNVVGQFKGPSIFISVSQLSRGSCLLFSVSKQKIKYSAYER